MPLAQVAKLGGVFVVVFIVALIVYPAVVPQAGVGSANVRILQENQYTTVVIEVHFHQEVTPDAFVLNELRIFLATVSGKSISVQQFRLDQPVRASYALQDIKVIETTTRAIYDENTISLFVVFLDGASSQGNSIAGFTFGPTSVVVFKGAWLAINPTNARFLELAVLKHEFGHILGLCEINYKSDFDHCDGKGHSKNSASVMFEKIKIAINVGYSTNFDGHDLQDLANIRSGKYVMS